MFYSPPFPPEMSQLAYGKIFASALLAGAAVAVPVAQDWGGYFHRPIVPGEVQVYFSPNGGCASAVVKVLAGARKSIYVQAYSFTNSEIAGALVAAQRRGVQTHVILDRSQETEKYSEADYLSHAGVPTFIDAAHAIAHNKVMIVDEETVITGSFRLARAAEEKNAENLLILRESPALAQKYLSNWQAHQRHSGAYRRH